MVQVDLQSDVIDVAWCRARVDLQSDLIDVVWCRVDLQSDVIDAYASPNHKVF